MGGPEGARGYVYQAFACTLEALSNLVWDRIFIEFKSENDKVDIALEFDGKIIKTIQVKSSINQFTSTKILKWISDLIGDHHSEEYALYLIGSCDKEADVLVKSLKKHNEGIEDKESIKSLNKVDTRILDCKTSVKKIPFELSALESIVRDSLHKYISTKDCKVSYEGLDLIANAVNNTFMLLSTNGNYIEKEEFDKKIFQWLNAMLGSYISNSKLNSKCEIKFYDKFKQEFSKSAYEIKIKEFYGYKGNTKEITERMKELIDVIESIKIPIDPLDSNESSKLFTEEGYELSKIYSPKDWGFINEKTEKFLEMNDNEKLRYINSIKQILNIDVDDTFFNVGYLSQIKNVNDGSNSSLKLIGSDDEKDKYKYIQELIILIQEHELINIFLEPMEHCSIVPLVIKNIGNISDSDMKIKIYVPKSVEIYNAREYPNHEYVRSLFKIFATNDGIIEKIFTVMADSKVSVEKRIMINDPRTEKFDVTGIYGESIFRNKYTSEDFYSVFEHYINQTIYNDDDNYNVLEYHIKEIFPKQIKALPNLLIIHSLQEDIEIKYNILSPNSDGLNEGTLKLKARALA